VALKTVAAGTVVGSMYPAGMAPRIPLLSVTGTNGKTTTVRMIARLLRQAGLRVGMACTDAIFADRQFVYAADASGPRSARDGAR